MSSPELTIGMAHMRDYDGVYFTVQALKVYHDVSQVELIVIDNSPDAPEGHHVRNLVQAYSNKFHSAKYLPFKESMGTTQTRERVFTEARAPSVMCMDCHVLLDRDAVQRLIQYWKQNPQSKDIVTGPLLYDNAEEVATHFDMVWRTEMWGIWAQAVYCRNCNKPFVIRHSQSADIHTALTVPHGMFGNLEPICSCGDVRPVFPIIGHQAKYKEYGYHYAGLTRDEPPFEIPAQGLGVFSMRKQAWPGFNKHMRGFGGEEGYIHEKVRQRGGKALCLPFLRWNHRFTRPAGVPYPLSRFDKIRNYVLAWQELGKPLNEIHEHFVGSRLMSQWEWDELVKDPINAKPTTISAIPGVNPSHLSQAPSPEMDINQLFDWTCTIKRDLEQHLPTLRKLASRVSHVTEITKRRESTVGLAAGEPAKLVTYTSEIDPLNAKFVGLALKKSESKTSHDFLTGRPNGSISQTDLLFIDDRHNGPTVREQLRLYADSVSRYIVFHDTVYHAQNGDEGVAEGIIPPIREFVESPDNDWFVAEHYDNEYGLTVLSRHPEDKPQSAIYPWPPGWGVGTEVKKLLKAIGIVPTPNCLCNARAETMDRNGAAWCELNREVIIGWLKEEADKRKIPFAHFAGSMLLNRAIKRAKKVKKNREQSGLSVH